MADFDSVRDSINASIKQNGTGAITGPVLNGVLNEMVDAADDQVSQLGQEVEEFGTTYVESPEYIRAYVDNDGKFLWGIKADGSIEWAKGVSKQIVDALSEKVDKEVGKSLINSDFADSVSFFNDPEGRVEITTDSDGKILAERKKDGVLVEKVGIETPKISAEDATFNTIELGAAGVKGLNEQTRKSYKRVTDAADAQETGLIEIGENLVIGLKEVSQPYTAADLEAAYKNVMPNPIFPYVKEASLHRLYDDAATPNPLYICSHSDTHIFYSICPTDTKRAVMEEGYYTRYNANYFYYADKNTPSDIHKVVLPEAVDGRSMVRRIKYIFEMSNGDCLMEIGNGEPVEQGATAYHNNIYKVTGVFENRPITVNDITLSLSFDYYLEKISSFENITEYKAGHIVLAPYWGGRSGKVYITKDYGNSWDLIFCTDPNNTHFIKPKAEHFGDANAYGIYPTPELLNPEGAIDWDATQNGNVHVHGIAYDRWYDRIWIVTGDGGWTQVNDVTGIWWTDDEGYTWKRIGDVSEIGTQAIGIIPMEKCVLFPTDGGGDGFWRWSRNGKDTIISVENCYNFLGERTSLEIVGARSTKAPNGAYLQVFAPNYPDPNHQSEGRKGGIVATYNGFDFQKIYEDTFSEVTYDTMEVGYCCDIIACEDKLILTAYHGGYIEIRY